MEPYSILSSVLTLFSLLAGAHGGVAHGSDTFPWNFFRKFGAPFKSSGELWTYAFVSTALISAAPFFILFFIPIHKSSHHSSLLKVLLSFASGGLLGDAFLHLIPHAISPHDHGGTGKAHAHHHHHDHTNDMVIGLWVLAGIISFLAVEKFVRLAKGNNAHSHGHLKDEDQVEPKVSRSKDIGGVKKRKSMLSVSGEQLQDEPHRKSRKSNKKSIKVSAYLNLAADFTHNFTDGLAIGASYLAGRDIGLITSFTILLHEIPHEIGDFAILIQSGYRKKHAMLLQLGTAVGAMIGTACGLIMGKEGSSVSTWILPFTAGGFIYIATVTVIPELLEKSSLWQSLVELLAMVVGISMMVFITFLE